MTLEELIQQSNEAQSAQYAAAQAHALVTTRLAERDAVIVENENRLNLANSNVQRAKADLATAQAVAATQLAEATAALAAFVNAQPEGVPAE